jgi:hypothetical protein
MPSDLPESLSIALDAKHLQSIEAWWNQLTDVEQRDFIGTASTEPELVFEPLPATAESDDGEPNEWYEYVVNQDVRFYLDVANGEQTSHGWLTKFTMTPIGLSADAQIVSHILSRPAG